MNFYRVVKSNPPTEEDFLSYAARGIPVRDPTDEETLLLAAGVSVFATEAQARGRARARPELGAYLARLQIPDDGSGQPLRGHRGHHTIWAEPKQPLAWVKEVVAVGPLQGLR